MKKRVLSWLLVLSMLLGIFPVNAFATETGNQTPIAGEDIEISMKLNEWKDLDLSQYFTDGDGDALTYYVSDDKETWTQTGGASYSYYPAGTGEQHVYFKAADTKEQESGIVTLTAEVETPPDVVNVMFSVTKGTQKFYKPEETTKQVLFPVELTVPYFDLAKYGLDDYYYNPRCYSTHKEEDTEYVNGQLPGTKETADGIVTVLHVFIYATEVLYLGYDKEDAGTGASYESGDFANAIFWTGKAGSIYMSLWDHGTNLNYYVDWDYPLGAYKWGSTSDQIALYGGEDIAVHMIDSKRATGSDFAYFTTNGEYNAESQTDEVTVSKGSKTTLTAVVSQPDWNGEYTTQYVAYADKEWVWAKEADAKVKNSLTEWSKESFGGNSDLTTDENGRIIIDATNIDVGEYYIAVYGCEIESSEVGPAIIKLNVICEHEWQDATCTEPSKCKLCGNTKGFAAGHNWIAANCLTPKTCSECHMTVGEADSDAHNYVDGVCTLCESKDAGYVEYEEAPVLSGSSSFTGLEIQKELYELDLSTVFTNGTSYTVSVNGEETVSCGKKYSLALNAVGAYKLVFTASNNKGTGPSYTVNLTVVHKDAIQTVDYNVKAGNVAWIAFTDENYNVLPEGTTYEWNAEKTTFVVTQPADINLNGKVMVFYKLMKDTPGAKLPLLTGSTALTGAGTKWDGGVRDRQTISLVNGEGNGEVYLYETTPSGSSNNFITIKFELDRTKPDTYFEYKTTGYATYTIAGEKGGVNGHTWITSDEVHIALNEQTPADAQLVFLENKGVTTLVDGAGSYTWDKKTIKYKIDKFPMLAEGQEAEAVANVPAGSTYNIDLSGLFVDGDEQDSLSYRVKINGGNMKKISGSSYSYTASSAGTYTLAFYAYDGFVYSEDCYTVTLTALNLTETFDVIVKNLPEGAEFYYNNGFNQDGTDILGGKLEAEYENGVYTVKVPANVGCIAIIVDECRITAEVSESNNNVTMQKTTFEVYTKAGDLADGTVTVTYGGTHVAKGKDNVYWLVSGDGYLFSAVPSEAYAHDWSRGGKSQAITTDKEATIQLHLEVNAPKSITIDKDAEVSVFYQWGYYRMYRVAPVLTEDNGDNTVTYTYACPESQAYAKGYMYFATKGDLIDKAGYMNSVTNTTITWEGENRKNDHRGTNETYSYMVDRTDDSVMVNINPQNHLVLNPGDTYRIRAFRIWEIINTDTENVMIEPQFIYSNYDENLVSLTSANEALAAAGKNQECGTGGNNWMDMTVTGAGLTFMEVSYEAIHIVDGYEAGSWGGAGGQPGNYLYSACDPARTALIVIQTDGKAATDVDFGIECLSAYVGDKDYYTDINPKAWDVEFDTLYFLGEKGEMKFSPSVKEGSIASVAVSSDKGESWTTLTAKDGVYTADIYSGNNVIRVTKSDGTTAYQVVRGDEITYTTTITSDLNSNGEVDPGDTVYVKLNGLHNPVGKMSGVYNPGFSAGQRVAYTWNNQQVRQSSYHQYSFVTNAEISVTVPEDAAGDYALTDGYIHFNVFGDMPGTHRDLTDDGRPVNTTAESGKHTRSLLPDILIYDDPNSVEVTKGDINGDGIIDTVDASLVISYYYGKVPFDKEQETAADVNGDGTIDTIDASNIISFYYGKISNL